MRVIIEKIVYPGRRLARSEGRVYLTDEGIPGESVEIVPLREHKSYTEATTSRIVIPSAERLPPRCAHYLACSSLQTLAYESQLRAKSSQLGEILAPLLESSAGGIEIKPSPVVWRYRNRLRLSFLRRGGRLVPVYHLPGSREDFVPVEDCHLGSETANRLIQDIARIAAAKKGANLRDVEVRESRSTGEILVSLFWRARRETGELDPLIAELVPRYPVAGVASFVREKGVLKETLEWGRGTIQEKLGETVYEIGPDSFFQVNISILSALLSDMREAAGWRGGEKIADIYGGLGTFGLAFARDAGRVYIVESEAENVRRLRENIARNKAPNVAVCEGTAEEWIAWILDQSPNVVIVDPPRKGLAPEVMSGLFAHPVGKILYLSCNPTTLARDLALLRERYAVASVRGYDFFPHTPHIETLAVLLPR